MRGPGVDALPIVAFGGSRPVRHVETRLQCAVYAGAGGRLHERGVADDRVCLHGVWPIRDPNLRRSCELYLFGLSGNLRRGGNAEDMPEDMHLRTSALLRRIEFVCTVGAGLRSL